MPDRKLLLHFRTSYFTQWGEHVTVCGEGPLFGNWDVTKGQRLACRHVGDELLWEGLVPIPAVPEFTYRLGVVNEAFEVVKWASDQHTVVLPAGLEDGAIVDVDEVWTDGGHPSLVLARSAFARVVWRNRSTAGGGTVQHLQPMAEEVVVRLQVHDGELKEGETVCVLGGAAQLGNWQLQEVLSMIPLTPSCWEAEVRIPLSSLPCTYKYGIRRADGGSLQLESGENRMMALPANDATRPPALVARFDGCFRRQQRWRGAGVSVPVFSIRSAHSVGAGEFLDLVPLVDLCAATGFSLIQVLPVSDTSVRGTWRDSYPYSALCVFALHPMYLRLQALSDDLTEDIAADIEACRKELDVKAGVDYEKTMEAKLRIARAVFDRQGQADMEGEGFARFRDDSWEWLQPYAVFCMLRRMFGTGEHWRWGTLSHPTKEMLDRLSSPSQEWHASIRFTYWLQYHLHKQLLQASQYAAKRNVALKGDLPIGVDKCSVDTWLGPRLFHMDVSTGAPPDYFDPNGQNWGFPTYNWEEMAKDGYLWWRRRLAHMAQYFHCYRIDHILGFFRIWEIPGDCSSGILGHFRPSIPLSRNELESRGIWDFDRLCEPWITDEVLHEVFGAELAPEVAAWYLQEQAGGRYRFRKQYSSEAALAVAPVRQLTADMVAEDEERVRRGLLTLRQNVVLLRDAEDANSFYPRIALHTTTSFQALDERWREELLQLHNEYYHQRQDALWRQQSHRTLPALMGATDMLVCGEDLGMIPSCVHPVMAELGLTGLRIQRMPAEEGAKFGDPMTYPYMTVASPSSHDTSTMRGWWEEEAQRRQEFYTEILGGEGDAPAQCTAAVLEHILQQHMDSPSLLAIFPLQDLLPLSAHLPDCEPRQQQINDPTNAQHYWRYRLHTCLEDIAADADLRHLLADMLQASMRYHGEQHSTG